MVYLGPNVVDTEYTVASILTSIYRYTITINVPVVYTALDKMILIGGKSIFEIFRAHPFQWPE